MENKRSIKFKFRLECLLALNLLLSCVFVADAFEVNLRNRRVGFAYSRLSANIDDSEAFKDAMKKTKEFGPTSSEAKIAWEVVEEIDEVNDRDRKLSDGEKIEINPYTNHIHNLSLLLQEAKPALHQMKTLCGTLKQLEVDDPQATKIGKITDSLAMALSEARASDDIYGPNSDEASDAWDNVQLFSSGVFPDGVRTAKELKYETKSIRYKEAALTSHHHFYDIVDPRSLEEAIDAIGKLERFAHQVKIEKNRIDSSNVGKMRP